MKLTTLAVAGGALLAVAGGGIMLGTSVSFFDASDPSGNEPPGQRSVSSDYPLPVRQAGRGKGATNVTLQACATGGIPLNEVDDLTAWISDDGGSYTDDTTDANDAGTGDTTVFPATPAEDDAVYIGHAGTLNKNGTLEGKFNGIYIDIGTAGSTSMTVTWEYWDNQDDDEDGTKEWDTLTFVRQDVVDFDETAGTYWNTFDPPSDWAPIAINGVRGYYVRARVSAFTSTTTSAVVDQAQLTTLDTDVAKQIIIRTDSDETEDVWCLPVGSDNADDVAVDNGFVIDAGTGALTVEVEQSAGEWLCCGDGGTTDMTILRLGDRG